MTKKRKRLLWGEQKALEILEENPWWSNNRVGVEMVRLGYTKDSGYLNKRIWKEKYGNKRPFSEPLRRHMLRYYGDSVHIWNQYHKDEDET